MLKTLFLICVLSVSAVAQECFCYFDVSGRVLDQYGRGVRNTRVQIDGCADLPCTEWSTKYAYTNTFGYFKFSDVPMTTQIIDIRNRSASYTGVIQPHYQYHEFVLIPNGSYMKF